MIELLTEPAITHGGNEVAVRCTYKSDVHFFCLNRSHSAYCLLFHRQQEVGLELKRHVADLVHEQRSLVCLVEESALGIHGARKRPLHMTEEFALEELAGDVRNVYCDERVFGTTAHAMQGVGNEFLSCTCFTGDEDVEVCATVS